MDKIKSLLKHQKEIVEGFVVSAIGSWALCSIIRGAYKHVSHVDFGGAANIIVVLCLFVIGMALLTMVYIQKANVARIAMFVLVYVFTLLCACEGFKVEWTTAEYYNQIGNVCFQVILCLITVLAFIYVKEDIFDLFQEVKISKRTTNIIIAVIGIFIFVFVGIVTVYRYLTYSNSTFDFGIFAQMYEYMKQKGIISTTVERNYLLSHFAVHFSPIFYIALPIYFIFSGAVTVQLIQAFMVALPVIPIVLLCRHYKLSNWMAVALSLLYVLYPATAGGTLYDIHENCFITFFLLMLAWAVEKKKNIWIAVFALLTFMVKEDAPVYVFILGLFYLFSRKDKKRGLLLILASGIYFMIATAIVNSFGMGIQEYRFKNLYFTEEGGLIQVFETMLANPGYLLSQIVRNTTENGMDKIGYILSMVVPMAAVLFSVGKKYSRYILLLPFIIINLLPTYLYMHDITFQYDFSVIALFMYAIIMNVSGMEIKKAKTVATISVICASIMFMGSIYQKAPHYVLKYKSDKATIEQLDKALDMIPEDASVCASGFFVPHLSKNLIMYDQNHLNGDVYTDYLAVDDRYEHEKEKFVNILSSGKYEQVYNVEGIISIYHRVD